jgi:hypothetical protein
VSAGAEIPLAEQRRALREQLGAQRVRLARDLADGGAGGGGFPRSVTLRCLIQEPELVARVVRQVVGGRVVAAIPAALSLLRLVRSASAARSQR